MFIIIYKHMQIVTFDDMKNSNQIILELARQRGILRSRDLLEQNLPRVTISRLVSEGRLIQLSRGLYSLPERSTSEQATYAEVAIRYPNSIFCLYSALQLHGLTTQTPHQVWLAVMNRARSPNLQYPPLKVVRFSDASFAAGCETIVLDGVVRAQVTGVEKTVVDCFKFRRKIGIDVAIEALQDASRTKRLSMDKGWEFAKICRVSNVMMPYLESLKG